MISTVYNSVFYSTKCDITKATWTSSIVMLARYQPEYNVFVIIVARDFASCDAEVFEEKESAVCF